MSDSSSNIAPSRILRHAPQRLFGREPWLEKLNRAWEARDRTHVFTLVAWGGVGKTSLAAHWVRQRFAAQGWPNVERYYDWSFYSQGTGESRQSSADLFIDQALRFFGDPDPTAGGPWQRGERLANLVRQRRTLLVLDGVEPLQYPPSDRSGQAGRLKDQALEALLLGLAADNPGLCLVTTREPLANLQAYRESTAPEQTLDRLPLDAATDLLRHIGIAGGDQDIAAAWQAVDGHALTLQLLGRFIVDAFPDRDICHFREVKLAEADRERQGRSAFKVMAAYERWLAGESSYKHDAQTAGLADNTAQASEPSNDTHSLARRVRISRDHQRELAILRLTASSTGRSAVIASPSCERPQPSPV